MRTVGSLAELSMMHQVGVAPVVLVYAAKVAKEDLAVYVVQKCVLSFYHVTSPLLLCAFAGCRC